MKGCWQLQDIGNIISRAQSSSHRRYIGDILGKTLASPLHEVLIVGGKGSSASAVCLGIIVLENLEIFVIPDEGYNYWSKDIVDVRF